MLPFLAMSHLLPFAHRSNILAQRGGIRVTFISTPRNLTRPPELPDHAECNIDVPPNKRHLINKAFDLLQQPVARFLEEAKPGISSAFFSTSTAAMLGFQGPPEALLRGYDQEEIGMDTVRDQCEDAVFKLRKFAQIMPPHEEQEDDTAGPNDTVRFGMALTGSDLEPEWFDLVSDLYKKPIIRLVLIPPAPSSSTTEPTCAIFDWLSEQKVGSVVYVALGTQVAPSQDEIGQLALGLEQCGLPFLWVLRKSPWTGQAPLDMLPPGYLDPGESHVVDRLGSAGSECPVVGREEAGRGDSERRFCGRFTSDAVAESIRVAMVEEGGKCVRENICKMKEMLVDGAINDKYIDEFVQQLSRM
uniref:Uncharacterized protein n=1 Tax=Kalanchoe fedtschenkoi TaxID=63787 RepID=A0A7N0UGZ5_KALFE